MIKSLIFKKHANCSGAIIALVASLMMAASSVTAVAQIGNCLGYDECARQRANTINYTCSKYSSELARANCIERANATYDRCIARCE